MSSFPGDSDAQSGLTTRALSHPPALRATSQRPLGPSDFQFPPPRRTEGASRPGGSRGRAPARLPPRGALARGLHNGPRGGSREVSAVPPLLAPRQREPGGAANMAERRRHKKRIQVAKPSLGVGGIGALGSGRSGGSPLEGRAGPTARWGGVLSPGRRLRGCGWPEGRRCWRPRRPGLRCWGSGGRREAPRGGRRSPPRAPLLPSPPHPLALAISKLRPR